MKEEGVRGLFKGNGANCTRCTPHLTVYGMDNDGVANANENGVDDWQCMTVPYFQNLQKVT